MVVNNTSYGIEFVIPETEVSSEFRYELRQVRVLNSGLKLNEKVIAELEPKEKRLTKRFMKLAEEMEQFFQKNLENGGSVENWWEMESKLKGGFNVYFHDRMRTLEEKINEISFLYAINCGNKYSYCL